MKLYDFVYQETKTHATVTITITCAAVQKPTQLWFRTPLQHKHMVNPTADVFLFSVLPLAMFLGEDLVIDAPITDGVINRARRCISLLAAWPNTDVWRKLSKIRVKALQHQVVPTRKKSHGRAAFFSLGLDSFFTLQESEKLPSTRVSHVILGLGFDIKLNDVKLVSQVKTKAQAVAQATGKELLLLETNINHDFLGKLISWEIVHGFVLAGVGYFYARGLAEVLINSEDAMISRSPYGTHPDLAPLWSSAVVRILFYGTDYKRSEKTFAIRNNALAQKYLRVCWENRHSRYNCGECPKCLRTMLQLEAVGSLSNFSGFKRAIHWAAFDVPHEPKHRRFIWWELLWTLPLTKLKYRLGICRILLNSYWFQMLQTARKGKRALMRNSFLYTSARRILR